MYIYSAFSFRPIIMRSKLFLITVFVFTFHFPKVHPNSDSIFDHDLHQELYNQLFTNKSIENSGIPAAEEPDEISAGQDDCGYGSFFSSFIPACQSAIENVENKLLAETNTINLIAKAKEIRDTPNIHPVVWYSALTRVTFKRPDLRGLWKPSPEDVLPDTYINKKVLAQAEALRSSDLCVSLDEKVAEDNMIQNQLWYFREDIQVNSQHWFWHQMNPTNSMQDRRGELFTYFHHHILQRYNADRLAHGMGPIPDFKLEKDYILAEGYNPHLMDPVSGYNWDIRLPSSIFPEFVAGGRLTLNNTIQERDRILWSVDNGIWVHPNHTETISSLDGADNLAQIIEPGLSLNRKYYGAFHGNGHVLISRVNEAKGAKSVGVMGDTATAMRDPLFYRWHNHIDQIADRYKQTLPAYLPSTGDYPLIWKGVDLQYISVFPTSSINQGPDRPLKTFWSIKKIHLNRLLDFRGPIRPALSVCAKHLNHEDFGYHLVVNVDENYYFTTSGNATIRIFMAPRYSQNGKRFDMEQQRNLFFVMDIFQAKLKPGINVIMRYSTESTLTIPWEQFQSTLGSFDEYQSVRTGYCGCGWPEHLLLSKGTPDGMDFDIFAMVTDADEDIAVENTPNDPKNTCRPAPLICGILDQKYPDSKPMGYPFDRIPFRVLERTEGQYEWYYTRQLFDLDEYISFVPNMATTKITITHEDRVQD